MSSKELFRLSGLAGYVSSVLLIIFGIGWLILPEPNMGQAESLALIGTVAHVFYAFTLTGLYLFQYKETGRLGATAYFFSMAGNIFFTGGQLVSAYLLLTDSLGALAINLLPLGLLLFALANQRAGVLPATGAWLMFLGQFANRALPISGIDLPNLVQIVVFAAGIVLMSRAIRERAA